MMSIAVREKFKGEILYYIVNTDKDKAHEIRIELEDGVRVSRLDILACTEKTVQA